MTWKLSKPDILNITSHMDRANVRYAVLSCGAAAGRIAPNGTRCATSWLDWLVSWAVAVDPAAKRPNSRRVPGGYLPAVAARIITGAAARR